MRRTEPKDNLRRVTRATLYGAWSWWAAIIHKHAAPLRLTQGTTLSSHQTGFS